MPREKSLTPATPRKRAPRKATDKGLDKTLAITKVEPAVPSFVGPEQRAALIAEAAYFRAAERGFAPGHEVEDWLSAEAEVDANLLKGAAPPQA